MIEHPRITNITEVLTRNSRNTLSPIHSTLSLLTQIIGYLSSNLGPLSQSEKRTYRGILKEVNNAPLIDFGPLRGLIGIWTGESGTDVAPEPEGEEKSPYLETLTFSSGGDVTNAGKQTLAWVHYHQSVTRKSDGTAFHNETGYWIWDAENSTVMQSFVIPRGVCVLAGGHYSGEQDELGRAIVEVSASLDDDRWSITQSPFMFDNARTTEFSHRIAIGESTLTYSERTLVNIYGKTFEHTDQNDLVMSNPC